jgi:hypothetical protein
MCQHRPDYPGKFIGHRHDYDVQRTPLFHLRHPWTWLFHAINNAPRAVHEQSPEIGIASLI